MNTPVLLNTNFQKQLDQKGFVKIPFWDEATVREVKQKYEQEFKSKHISQKQFHTTYETVNIELINQVKEFLLPLFIKSAERYLKDMAPISASYLIKSNSPESGSPLHQDASFVNEPEFCSVSVWIALQDADWKNGCLQFVPGSHRLIKGPRFIPYSNNQIEQYAQLLKPYLTQHSIRTGEAFIFYNAVLHASPPNRSLDERLAVVMGFYNSAARLSLYLKNETTGQIDRYAISTEQLTEINATFKPKADQLISSEFCQRPLVLQDVQDFIRSNFTVLTRMRAGLTRQFFKQAG